jgi:hypothetical protein
MPLRSDVTGITPVSAPAAWVLWFNMQQIASLPWKTSPRAKLIALSQDSFAAKRKKQTLITYIPRIIRRTVRYGKISCSIPFELDEVLDAKGVVRAAGMEVVVRFKLLRPSVRFAIIFLHIIGEFSEEHKNIKTSSSLRGAKVGIINEESN